jgi:hypothetical protein
VRQEDQRFKVSLGYIERLVSKKGGSGGERERKKEKEEEEEQE